MLTLLPSLNEMNGKDIQNLFHMLEVALSMPQSIFNVDESGIQLINRTAKLVVKKMS
jgi:hypothetical protein